MKTQKLKPIPHFKNEDEEFEFWSTHDSTEYVDWSKARKLSPSIFNSLTESESIQQFMIHDAPIQEKSKKKK